MDTTAKLNLSKKNGYAASNMLQSLDNAITYSSYFQDGHVKNCCIDIIEKALEDIHDLLEENVVDLQGAA